MTVSAPTSLQACLAGIDTLKVFPTAALRVLRLAKTPDARLAHMEEALASDPVLAAAALKIANSPLLGLRDGVKTIQRAVHVLGLDGTRQIALTAIVGAISSTAPPWGPLLHRHALLTAGISRLLARRTPRVNGSEAFVVGLLHDLGLQLLLTIDTETTTRLLDTCYRRPTLLDRAERMHFGFTHAELSALCIRQWGLPASVAIAVSAHHEPVPTGRVDPARHVLAGADALAELLADGAPVSVLGRSFVELPIGRELGLAPPDIMGLMEEITVFATEV
jgi:HD-like signal output (HDOD) protein